MNANILSRSCTLTPFPPPLTEPTAAAGLSGRAWEPPHVMPRPPTPGSYQMKSAMNVCQQIKRRKTGKLKLPKEVKP